MKEFVKSFPHIASALKSGGRSSAMQPALFIALFALLGMWLVPSELLIFSISVKALLALVFCVVMLSVIAGFAYLLFTNPRLLQSEKYQLAMRQMDMEIAVKGKLPEVTYEPDSPAAEMYDANIVDSSAVMQIVQTDKCVVGVVEGEK